jgi:peptidyl-prolyl cis-trans isomerase SurA
MIKYQALICALLCATLSVTAQVASHAPTGVVTTQPKASSLAAPMQVRDKPVVKVNGVVLTDRDLLREMFTIFPYARQHNGFPKSEEAEIRKGALGMIVFEELVYQHAIQQKLTVPQQRIDHAVAEFKNQFQSPDEYRQYLQGEMHGSEDQVRRTIVRSLLIERVLKTEVENKSVVSPAELRAYYDKNPVRFQQPESFTIQTISILPPLKPTPEQAKAARKQADDALPMAKAAKSADEFGLLAEKISQDDFRVNMGKHKPIGRDKMPPQVLHALLNLKPGQITGVVQIDSGYTIIRMDAHTPAGKLSFEKVKVPLGKDLQKEKYERLRVALDKSLRARSKIEIL